MEYRLLGRSGLRVSQFSLGSARFGLGPTPEEAPRLVSHAIDVGINFFDSGFAYGNRSAFDREGFPPAAERESAEAMLGAALKGRRHGIVLASKVGETAPEIVPGPDGRIAPPGPNDGGRDGGGLTRQHMMRTIDESLRRLQTDYLDIYYAHWPDPTTPLAETLRTFDALVHQGKIRYYAFCNFKAWQIVQAFWLCERYNLHEPICLQFPYSLANRQVEDFVIPVAKMQDMTLNCYSPLGAGLLAGSEGRATNPERRPFNESQLEYVRQVEDLAAHWGLSTINVALSWLFSKPVVSSAILGSETVEELDSSLKALDIKLDPEQIQLLEAIAPPPASMVRPPGSFHGPPF